MQTCSSNKSSKLQSNGNVKLGLVKFSILYHKHKESLDFGVKVSVVQDNLLNHYKHLTVQEGDFVEIGAVLVDVNSVPHDILRVKGVEALSTYLTKEVQDVYLSLIHI